MNKKEISEIKKQLTPENCALTRLCACYVDGEKNKKSEMKEAFLSQSEEECFKYFEIFIRNPYEYTFHVIIYPSYYVLLNCICLIGQNKFLITAIILTTHSFQITILLKTVYKAID